MENIQELLDITTKAEAIKQFNFPCAVDSGEGSRYLVLSPNAEIRVTKYHNTVTSIGYDYLQAGKPQIGLIQILTELKEAIAEVEAKLGISEEKLSVVTSPEVEYHLNGREL